MKSNFLAFMCGAMSGAVIALLTTTRTGEETRKMIGDKMKKGAEYTKKELEDLGEWVKEKLHNNEFVQEAKEKVENTVDDVSHKVDDFKNKYDSKS